MSALPAAGTSQAPRRFRLRSVRSRIFALVSISGATVLLGSLVALLALNTVHSEVVRLDTGSVKTLATLGDLRDMEGDMRTGAWAYLAAAKADRPGLLADAAVTDKQADADIEAFLVANGSRTDATARFMRQFADRLATWRQVRDQQVIPLARQDKTVQAYAAMHGPLAAADDGMSGPMDALFAREVAVAEAQRHSADRSYLAARIAVLSIIVGGLALALLAAWLLTAGMLATVRAISGVLGSDDPALRVGSTDSSEIGSLASALDVMLDDAAARDLALRAEQEARESQLRRAHVRQQLAEKEVRRRAQEVVDDTARSVLTELETVAAQAQAVRTAASTIESRVDAADSVAREVVDRANSTDTVVTAVNESLRRVGGIAKLIAGVAAQTNLLALNATIEAARAGESGKGFAVVASEVKELAATTERSTTEISVTLATLERDAAAMAATIVGMTEQVGSLGVATADLTTVAGEQQQTAARLDRSVSDAIERIQLMGTLTDRLDRRASERVDCDGSVRVVANGTSHELSLLDLSDGGLAAAATGRVTLSVGNAVAMHLQTGTFTAELQGKIVRRSEGGDGLGGDELSIAFVGLTAANQARLSGYLQSVVGSRQNAPAAR